MDTGALLATVLLVAQLDDVSTDSASASTGPSSQKHDTEKNDGKITPRAMPTAPSAKKGKWYGGQSLTVEGVSILVFVLGGTFEFSFQVSQPQDGGTDTGAPDTGIESDTGAPDGDAPDVGTEPDTGTTPDTGVTPDTGPSAADTGATPAPDAGGGTADETAGEEETGGCSCAVVGV